MYKLEKHINTSVMLSIYLHAPVYTEYPFIRQFKSGTPAPEEISKPDNAIAYKNIAYFRGYGSRVIYAYNANTLSWFRLPKCPVKDTSLVLISYDDETEPTLHTLGGLLVQEGSTEAPLVGDLYCLSHPSTSEYY